MDIIFDIDGTLADLTHRLHWIKSKPKNYKAFMEACPLDGEITPVVRLARALDSIQFSTGPGEKIRLIFCSGRSDEYREQTAQWLAEADLGPDHLYMRKAGDYRKDSIVKSELLDQIRADGFNPQLVFDDRQQVVDMWRERGLICCQVAKGDF